ncbi:MAG: alpha/beta fold hydrolase [Polaromonas sp.]|jgi:pimeloyl-ACP methyl ester carboxylesterase
MYKEKRTSRSEFVPIRGLRYHVRIWQGNNPSSTVAPLVLVHGWMDVAASYQFMVDALSHAFATGRTIIAPDWRGFGLTKSVAEGAADNYWFPDYLADLDFLLDHYVQDQKIDLVGHSMGGNVAMIYAGVRPERIRRLVNLEGFGLAPSKPAQAPTRYAKWIDELKTLHKGELDLKAYDEVSGVAKRLMKTNPRLSEDKANWLASHWAQQDADGQWLILGEPGHKVVSANIYRVEETLEIYKRITAPVLAVEASDDSLEKWNQGRYTLADYHERLKLIADAKVAVVADAGHMLHHDRPEALAKLIEDFLK